MHNYPGNAANFPANIGQIDDSDDPDATNFGVATEGLADRTAYLVVASGKPGQNWRNAFTPTDVVAGTGTVCHCEGAAWDPLLSRWLAVGFDTGTGESYGFWSYGLDDGNGWLPMTMAASPEITSGGITTMIPWAICADPTTAGAGWAAFLNSASPAVSYLSGGAAAWTLKTSGLVAASVPTSAELATFNGNVVVVFGGTTTPVESSISSTPNTTPTWTNYAPAQGATQWRLKTSPNEVIALPITGNAGVAWTLYRSIDGVNWTEITIGIAANERPAGLCYSVPAGIWYLFARNTSTGASTVYFSGDGGQTWNPVGSVGAGPHNIVAADLAIQGQSLVATLQDDGSGAPGASGQVFSPNGGVSWYFSQATANANVAAGSNLDFRYSRLCEANGIGLLAYNSIRMRFSHLCALPPLALP